MQRHHMDLLGQVGALEASVEAVKEVTHFCSQ